MVNGIDIVQIVINLVAAGIIGIGGSYLTYRLATARTEGRDEQRWIDQERRMNAVEMDNAAAREVRAANAVRLESMAGDLRYLINTVGADGEHGLRGNVHGLRNEVMPLLLKIETRMETLMEDRRLPSSRTRSDD